MRRSSLGGRTAGTPQASEDKIKAAGGQIFYTYFPLISVCKIAAKPIIQRFCGDFTVTLLQKISIIFYAQSASAVSAQTALPAGMAKNAHIPDSGAGRAHNPKKLLFRQFLRPVNAGVNRPNYDILQPAFLKHLYRLDGGAAGGADFDFKLFGRILTFHCQLCRA